MTDTVTIPRAEFEILVQAVKSCSYRPSAYSGAHYFNPGLMEEAAEILEKHGGGG